MHAQDTIEVNVLSDGDAGGKRLTVDPGQAIHEAIAEAFGCERQEQVQRVLFGDIDVLKGESFEEHGIEVGGVTLVFSSSSALPTCMLTRSSSPLDFV